MPQRQGAGRRNADHTGQTRISSVATTGGEPNPAAARSKPREPPELAPGLYLVATPIGNTEDITLRALKTLAAADVIVCEDTRVSAKLLARHGIERPLLAYHEHNAERTRPLLLERLKRGERLALISDAGTPLVSDPGFKLVRAAVAADLPVTTLPGPSAALAGLVLSGLPSDRFLFAGFLPPKTAARRRALAELETVKATLIFFESGPRLADALADMVEMLGKRDGAVARELTKLYEEVRRGDLAELAAQYRAAGPPRGELVVVVGPPDTETPAVSEEALDRQLAEALGRMSIRDASAAVAAATGKPRREVYARALLLAGRGE
jgi:16S rRNA (cytidine1402-2'-O)-methyltransferase